MLKNPSNIVLIGMPGSGKSTAGIILAKLTSRDFVDTDVLIQTSQGRTLQDIVDTEGSMVLREIEEGILLKLDCFNHVIATGGSAVYSHAAMTHLKFRIRALRTCLRNVLFYIERTQMLRLSVKILHRKRFVKTSSFPYRRIR
jgi:shikimate kinase